MSLKKGQSITKKGRIQIEATYRISMSRNGPTKLPFFLIILGSIVDFFDNVLLLYPPPCTTLLCRTQKPFWISRTVAPKLFCIGLPLFEARYRKWSTRTCCRLAKRISRKKGRCRNGRKQTLQQPGGPVFEFWNQIFDHVHGSCAWATSTTQPDSTF